MVRMAMFDETIAQLELKRRLLQKLLGYGVLCAWLVVPVD